MSKFGKDNPQNNDFYCSDDEYDSEGENETASSQMPNGNDARSTPNKNPTANGGGKTPQNFSSANGNGSRSQTQSPQQPQKPTNQPNPNPVKNDFSSGRNKGPRGVEFSDPNPEDSQRGVPQPNAIIVSPPNSSPFASAPPIHRVSVSGASRPLSYLDNCFSTYVTIDIAGAPIQFDKGKRVATFVIPSNVVKKIFSPDPSRTQGSYDVTSSSVEALRMEDFWVTKIFTVKSDVTYQKPVSLRWVEADWVNTIPCSYAEKKNHLAVFVPGQHVEKLCVYDQSKVVDSSFFQTYGHLTIDDLFANDVRYKSKTRGLFGLVEGSVTATFMQNNPAFREIYESAPVTTTSGGSMRDFDADTISNVFASMKKQVLSKVNRINTRENITFKMEYADGSDWGDVSGTFAESSTLAGDPHIDDDAKKTVLTSVGRLSAVLEVHYVFNKGRVRKPKRKDDYNPAADLMSRIKKHEALNTEKPKN